MIKRDDLLSEREKLNSCLKCPKDDEERGRTYRKKADVNINLYLTEYVLENKESNYYKEAINNYQKAIELLKQLKTSHIHLSEAYLAHGNAIKEQFLPLHRNEKKDFTVRENEAKKEYKECVDLTLNIHPHLRGYFFAMLEQMNLETRKKVWGQVDCLPKRIAIFHSLESPLSQQFLEGVYYFAYQNLTEIWEYNYGRIPDSDKNEHFISDRLLDASGIIFLCPPDYNKDKKEIVKFEIQETKKLKERGDPIEIFALDLENKDVIDDLKASSPKIEIANENDFEDKIKTFLKGLKDIYYYRKFRCNNNT